MALRLGHIVDNLGGLLQGPGDFEVTRLAPLGSAGPSELSFFSDARKRSDLHQTRAGALVVPEGLTEDVPSSVSLIRTPDPYLYFSRLTRLWRAHHPVGGGPGVHPTAVVHPDAKVSSDAHIGPLCVVEAHAVVGPGTVLHSRVTLGRGCVVGARCVVHSGVVIGADGFGFAHHQGQWEKIEQLGAVRIGDDVEIGANTCIDRGALDDTVIGDGVKLDNLVQIGHNVHIGPHAALAGCVGVAGSAHIGAGCTIGGGAVVLGHLTLADGVHISAASVVTRSVMQPGQYTGFVPLDHNAEWEKNAAALKQLARLRERVRELEKNQGKPKE